MTQKFHYKKWEDYQAGMFRKVNATDDHWMIEKAVLIISSPELCYQQMKRVTLEWPFCSEQNLTNKGQNRRAWLGQAACCIAFNIPEELTKIAWNSLDINTQDRANGIADVVITEWEQCQKSI